MQRRLSRILPAILFIALSIQSDATPSRSTTLAQPRTVPAPQDVLGFTPGDDRKLASWSTIVEYFQKLDAASDRVMFEEIGKSTMGAPFVYATISAPENLRRVDEFKETQRQLADPRLLGSPTNPALADRKARALIARGKTIVLITCGIHSTEVGSTLSSTLIAHQLASSNDPEIQEILRNTIILLVPSLNPDGVDIVKNWYDKTLGTPYEGTEPPELYHKYVGHDNNRDWYAFTQVETQLTVDKLHNVWHPQIVHDIHQMGATGARLFLPPYLPPVEPNVPKQIVEGYTELGTWMAGEMRRAGFQGITTNSIYDAWTPARAYSHYHGGVRILSETASARLATPRTVKFDDLRARSESAEGTSSPGYDPKVESANFGPVWRGGEWRLRDITNYMTTGAFFLMKHAAQNREQWLTRFYEIGKEAVRPRKKGELWGFKINSASNWTSYYLEEILKRAGVEVIYTKRKPAIKNPRSLKLWNAQEAIVRMNQPYAAFAKALLERQHYPDLRSSEGHPIQPYDVTAHTLPLLMNVTVEPLFHSVKYQTVAVERMEFMWGKRPGFGVSIGLYKSYVPSMDEGWTRWAISHDANFLYEGITGEDESEGGTLRVNLHSLKDKEVRAGNLIAKYTSIIIPDQSPSATLGGHRKGAMPEEYTGGLGEKGVNSLREFVEQGGTLVCLNRASNFAIEQFKLPVRNVVAGLPRTEFYVPGSILRIELDRTNPITHDEQQAMKFGADEEKMQLRYDRVPPESIAWFENSPVFEVIDKPRGNSPTVREGSSSSVRIIAWYPRDKDPLLSGWLLGGDRLKGRAALVEVALGKGRIILFGFRPQYRAQSLATYPLLFNAITSK